MQNSQRPSKLALGPKCGQYFFYFLAAHFLPSKMCLVMTRHICPYTFCLVPIIMHILGVELTLAVHYRTKMPITRAKM
jgi:hypothetical protein